MHYSNFYASSPSQRCKKCYNRVQYLNKMAREKDRRVPEDAAAIAFKASMRGARIPLTKGPSGGASGGASGGGGRNGQHVSALPPPGMRAPLVTNLVAQSGNSLVGRTTRMLMAPSARVLSGHALFDKFSNPPGATLGRVIGETMEAVKRSSSGPPAPQLHFVDQSTRLAGDASEASLSMDDLQSVVSALLVNEDHKMLFGAPVDYIALGIPSYPRVIKEPMDLGTLLSRIRPRGTPPAEIVRLMRLVAGNAKTFNEPGSYVHDAAVELEKEMERLLADKVAAATVRRRNAVQPTALCAVCHQEGALGHDTVCCLVDKCPEPRVFMHRHCAPRELQPVVATVPFACRRCRDTFRRETGGLPNQPNNMEETHRLAVWTPRTLQLLDEANTYVVPAPAVLDDEEPEALETRRQLADEVREKRFAYNPFWCHHQPTTVTDKIAVEAASLIRVAAKHKTAYATGPVDGDDDSPRKRPRRAAAPV